MLHIIRNLLGWKPPLAPTIEPRARLVAAEWPAVIYAIGDVHGCLEELLWLEELIAADARDSAGERWIITLGDHIDRGPQSAGVVEHLIGNPPPGFQRICLAGNHEQLLLDFLEEPDANAQWLEFGGLETAHSYGVRKERFRPGASTARGIARELARLMPETHIDFMRRLPIALSLPGFHFVHAGLRRGIPIAEQDDADLLWIREPFLEEADAAEAVVVHGHTPAAMPEIRPWRIGVDTGAFATGRLTAVRLRQGAAPTFLTTGRQTSGP
jgi:serine/threonine protein phosphatase 1